MPVVPIYKLRCDGLPDRYCHAVARRSDSLVALTWENETEAFQWAKRMGWYIGFTAGGTEVCCPDCLRRANDGGS